MSDQTLIWILCGLLFLIAFLKLALQKKRGEQVSVFYRIQPFAFPVLMLIAGILYAVGRSDIILPVIAAGIIEEILFRVLQTKKPQE